MLLQSSRTNIVQERPLNLETQRPLNLPLPIDFSDTSDWILTHLRDTFIAISTGCGGSWAEFRSRIMTDTASYMTKPASNTSIIWNQQIIECDDEWRPISRTMLTGKWSRKESCWSHCCCWCNWNFPNFSLSIGLGSDQTRLRWLRLRHHVAESENFAHSCQSRFNNWSLLLINPDAWPTFQPKIRPSKTKLLMLTSYGPIHYAVRRCSSESNHQTEFNRIQNKTSKR